MARKKAAEQPAVETPAMPDVVTPLPETPTPAIPENVTPVPLPETETTPGSLPASDTNGTSVPEEHRRRKPVMSFRCNSDRTTSLQAAVWANDVTYGDGTKGVQYSISLSRSWRDDTGQWHDSGKDQLGNGRAVSWRAHDVPVLLYLLDRAHGWCLAQRTTLPS